MGAFSPVAVLPILNTALYLWLRVSSALCQYPVLHLSDCGFKVRRTISMQSEVEVMAARSSFFNLQDKQHLPLAHFQDESRFLPRLPSRDDLIDNCCSGPVQQEELQRPRGPSLWQRQRHLCEPLWPDLCHVRAPWASRWNGLRRTLRSDVKWVLLFLMVMPC